ncbi:hypothetical protein V6N12_015485 [Hibiscus sabdariffa]|uniref:Pentatricopeptide repeat-containing protein n=1 Tax=Hibiscus sabdariffa TaxID=183260 RepID=A0ABR2DNA9_9ROSI
MMLYEKVGMYEHAHKLFDEMSELNCQHAVNSFNALLSAYLHSKKFDNVGKLTYNTKLRGLGRERKISKAVRFWEEMKSKGIEPDIRSYNALITGHCNAGNLEQVMKWYGELKKSCLPDRVTYITVLSFLRKKNEFEMASEICKEAMDQRMISGVALIDELVKESRMVNG